MLNKNDIRLSKEEIHIIVKVFKCYFLSSDMLWVFGSRVNVEKKGGDIDLYIETNFKDDNEITHARCEFWNELQDLLGEQKIDIIINNGDKKLLIYEIARKEGVQLV